MNRRSVWFAYVWTSNDHLVQCCQEDCVINCIFACCCRFSLICWLDSLFNCWQMLKQQLPVALHILYFVDSNFCLVAFPSSWFDSSCTCVSEFKITRVKPVDCTSLIKEVTVIWGLCRCFLDIPVSEICKHVQIFWPIRDAEGKTGLGCGAA